VGRMSMIFIVLRRRLQFHAFGEAQNPTYGSRWILQVLSTRTNYYSIPESHQRQLVDGSDPFYTGR
jgi:hypothetical protein